MSKPECYGERYFCVEGVNRYRIYLYADSVLIHEGVLSFAGRHCSRPIATPKIMAAFAPGEWERFYAVDPETKAPVIVEETSQ